MTRSKRILAALTVTALAIPLTALGVFELAVLNEGTAFAVWYDGSVTEPVSADYTELVWRQYQGPRAPTFERTYLWTIVADLVDGKTLVRSGSGLTSLVSSTWLSTPYERSLVLETWITRNMTPSMAAAALWTLTHERYANDLFGRPHGELTTSELAFIIYWIESREVSEGVPLATRCGASELGAESSLRGTPYVWEKPRYRPGHGCGESGKNRPKHPRDLCVEDVFDVRDTDGAREAHRQAAALEATGDDDGARKAYERCLMLDPNVGCRYDFGVFLLKHREAKRGRACVDRSSRIDCRDPYCGTEDY